MADPQPISSFNPKAAIFVTRGQQCPQQHSPSYSPPQIHQPNRHYQTQIRIKSEASIQSVTEIIYTLDLNYKPVVEISSKGDRYFKFEDKRHAQEAALRLNENFHSWAYQWEDRETAHSIPIPEPGDNFIYRSRIFELLSEHGETIKCLELMEKLVQDMVLSTPQYLEYVDGFKTILNDLKLYPKRLRWSCLRDHPLFLKSEERVHILITSGEMINNASSSYPEQLKLHFDVFAPEYNWNSIMQKAFDDPRLIGNLSDEMSRTKRMLSIQNGLMNHKPGFAIKCFQNFHEHVNEHRTDDCLVFDPVFDLIVHQLCPGLFHHLFYLNNRWLKYIREIQSDGATV